MSQKDSINFKSSSFKLVDANGDGFTTIEETANCFKKDSGGMITDSEAQSIAKQFIEKVDLDGNGKMSLGEYAMASMDSSEINRTDFETKYGSEEATKLFDQYDTNKDGKITQDEIKEVDKSMDKANDKSKGLSKEAIVAIVIGAVLLVGLIIALAVYFSKKKKKNKNKEKLNGNDIFDYNEKPISYDAKNNLDSINKQKANEQGAVGY